jgi:rhodanese-related sulfurtransferase
MPGRRTVLSGERGEGEVSIMLEGFDVTAETVKQSMHHGDPLMFIELRHHHKHDWSLFKARGALRIESDALEQHLAEIPHDRPIVVMSDCPGEEMSAQTVEMLRKHGWSDVHKLVRGFDAYLEAGLPVVPVSKSVPATKIMLL